jgi:fucose 4-O-acetylase-like acetyltransferase
MTQAPKKVRLEWLDALRGFTMILVVANHVGAEAFEIPRGVSTSLQFLVLFRMPLFFFVSGFLAYKASQVWNLATFGQLVGKKLRVQIIPTVVFFLLSAMILSKDMWATIPNWLHIPTKGGFWFTLVLLYMFLIYYVFAYIESKLKVKSWIPITLLFIVSLVCYETCYLPKYFSWAFGWRGHPNDFMNDTSLIQVFQYFPFFIYGNIVHRYWEQAQKVMDSHWFYPIIVVVVIFAAMDTLKWHTLRMAWAIIPLTLARFILLTMVVMYFSNYQQYFTKFSVIGASLQYIGRRTLDIYLIHYLFLPDLPTIGAFFDKYRHNFVLDTLSTVVIALLVIGFCIITSNILRVSPFFRKWLFGRS